MVKVAYTSSCIVNMEPAFPTDSIYMYFEYIYKAVFDAVINLLYIHIL